MTEILKQESDWDLMYYLETIDTWDEALKVIKTLRKRLIDLEQKEMDKEMRNGVYWTKADLVNRFGFIVEKQRGYPLWMWEYSDIEDFASSWASDNGYGYLFRDDD